MVIWGCQLWKPPDSQPPPLWPPTLTEPRSLFPLPFSRSPNPLLMVSNGGPEEDSSSGVWKSLLEWECRAWRSAQPSAPQTAPGPSCPMCTKTLKVTRATRPLFSLFLSFFFPSSRSLAQTHTRLIVGTNKQTHTHKKNPNHLPRTILPLVTTFLICHQATLIAWALWAVLAAY